MVIPAPWTEFHNTPNKSVRQNVPRLGVVLHHAAMTNLDTLIYLEMGAKQVSSTATCKDDRLPSMMELDVFRAWSLSDAYWDSALRSVETCNESVVGWTVSDASHWSLARAVAYWAQRDGFYPHRNGNPKSWTVLGHREVYTIHGGSYGTACPGGMDLDLVTLRAQGLLASTAGGGNTPIIDYALLRRQKEETMYIAGKSNADIYNIFTDANGHVRMRHCEVNEAAFATAGGIVIKGGDDATLIALAAAAGYYEPLPLPIVTIAATP